MKERPILFSAPMVRAILAGTKTQTRRLVKHAPCSVNPAHTVWDVSRCPYGQPGDRMWVRENGWERPFRSARDMREGADTWPPYEYDAEPVCCWEDGELKRLGWKRRPSIHMPRWASRILLEVMAVRVERLQDISEADAVAEGVDFAGHTDEIMHDYSPDERFSMIWESINGAGSWNENPWVWVVEFRRVEA